MLLAVAAAVVTIQLVNTTYFSAQQPVRDYLQAMRDGNGPKALGLLRADLPAASPALLDGNALKGATKDLKDVTIGDPQPLADGKERVGIDYQLAGTAGHTDFTLEPAGREWLFFGTWRFVPSALPTVDVSVVNQTQARINGVPVAMPGGRNSFSMLFPGRYTSTYNSQYFQAPGVDVTVTGPQSRPAAVALATAPTQELLSQVDNRIHAYLDGCAKAQVLLPAGCPLSASSDNRVVGPVQWSILTYPKVAISAYGGHWVMAPMSVKAQVSFKEELLSNGNVHNVRTAADFAFTARLGIGNDVVTVTPEVQY
ncbi:MAG: hypothetical protein ACHP7K_01700 [Actinomycetales bacterium]